MLREVLSGVAAGTVSGILPGIHVNTLGTVLRGTAAPGNLFLFSMGLTHTFLDVIPSTFLGVPDEGTALGILPAHRLVLQGKAMEVVRIALWASLFAVLLALPLMPLYLILAPLYHARVGRFIVLLLLFFLVLTEKGLQRVFAVAVFFLAGLLGIYTFGLGLSHPYYHLFTGLFGVPVLLMALFNGTKHIDVDDSEPNVDPRSLLAFSALGTLLGMAASLVPAFTPSQAALMGSFVSKEERSFLTVVFSVNTSNFLFSFVNFVETGRIRNGVIALMDPVGRNALEFYLLAAVFVSLLILMYGEALAAFLLGVLRRVPYRVLNACVLGFLLGLSLLFDGLLGLLVLLGGSLIGSLAVVLNVKRTNCMGVLMLPIIIGR